MGCGKPSRIVLSHDKTHPPSSVAASNEPVAAPRQVASSQHKRVQSSGLPRATFPTSIPVNANGNAGHRNSVRSQNGRTPAQGDGKKQGEQQEEKKQQQRCQSPRSTPTVSSRTKRLSSSGNGSLNGSTNASNGHARNGNATSNGDVLKSTSSVLVVFFQPSSDVAQILPKGYSVYDDGTNGNATAGSERGGNKTAALYTTSATANVTKVANAATRTLKERDMNNGAAVNGMDKSNSSVTSNGSKLTIPRPRTASKVQKMQPQSQEQQPPPSPPQQPSPPLLPKALVKDPEVEAKTKIPRPRQATQPRRHIRLVYSCEELRAKARARSPSINISADTSSSSLGTGDEGHSQGQVKGRKEGRAEQQANPEQRQQNEQAKQRPTSMMWGVEVEAVGVGRWADR
ncbi:hypothetical protein BDZ91DRAFT_795420 [Kalaharituber pfeilii]|nr:hypothetical protein BDZ91DRAFT_795420 [Kalaharituber pfeilii]